MIAKYRFMPSFHTAAQQHIDYIQQSHAACNACQVPKENRYRTKRCRFL